MFLKIVIAATLVVLARARDGNHSNEPASETKAGIIIFKEDEEKSENNCQTPNGENGICIIIDQCEPLRLILASRPNAQQTDFLRKSLCGYRGSTPMVCCNSCSTPDGQAGKCIDVRQCEAIRQLLAVQPVSPEALDYLRRSKCNGPVYSSVCCGSNPPPIGPGPGPSPTPGPAPVPDTSGPCVSATLPDFNSGCCGVDSGGGNRIIGGNVTGIDEYPWMALIEYRQGTKVKTLCGGALISSKYVLTAGHCVVGDVLKLGNPSSVRLGEYDTTSDYDCIPADGGGMDCSEPVVTVPIERSIPHPQYDPYGALRRNDIALLRLRNLAPYTDFIRPICLPPDDVTLSPPPPDRWVLRAAGWGATNVTSSSNKKLHVELPYQDLAECQKQYNLPRRNIKLWTKQLCAGGVKDRDSCKGDSGGPLMYERGSTYEILGVVSFGTTPCGMENVPGVYSKVYEYLNWIRSEVRP